MRQKRSSPLGHLASRWFVVLVALGLVPAVAPAQHHSPGPEGEAVITDARAATDIPITLAPFHAFLKVRVNGSEPLDFVFDTGASRSVISSRITEQLGIETQGSFGAMGAGAGSTPASMAPGVTYGVQGAELRDQTAISMPLDIFETRFGRRIDGIIGRGFLDKFVVEIDYAAGRMRLHDPKTYTYTGDGETIPISLTGGHSQVKARVTLPGRATTEETFAVDTGAGLNVLFTTPFSERTNALSSLENSIHQGGGLGVGGEITHILGRIESIQLGGFTFEHPVASFSQDKAGAGSWTHISGILGAGLFRRFTVIFDYSREQMILEPNDRLGQPFTMNLLGAGWSSPGDGDWDTVVVGYVRPDSAAERAGLEVDDVLISVDGILAPEIGRPILQEYFETDGQVVTLVLERDGERYERTITLEKVL